jgi:hypothetical protein
VTEASPERTPRTDAALSNPLLAASHGEVVSWLRQWEHTLSVHRARAAETASDACAESLAVCTQLVQAEADVTRALDDPRRGALPRLLRRPPWQLTRGAPARAAFDRLAERMCRTVSVALALQPLVSAAHRQLDELESRYRDCFPTLLDAALARRGLSRAALSRVSRIEDAERVQHRLGDVAREMAHWAELRTQWPDAAPAVEAKHEVLRGDELLALAVRALAERERLTSAIHLSHEVSVALARHAALAPGSFETGAHDASERDADRRGPAVRELLLTAARMGAQVTTAGEDAPLWAWVLGRAPLGHGTTWQSADLPAWEALANDVPSDHDALYVVPVDGAGSDGLLLLTRDVSTCVRIWSARVEPGREVQAVLSTRPGDETDPVAERDVRSVFDGLQDRVSASYETAVRPRLVVVAGAGRPGTWFARLVHRGALRRTNTPTWRAGDARVGRMRVLRPARADAVPLVEVAGQAGCAVLGLVTLESVTGLAGDCTAWLRAPLADTIAAGVMVARERLLFEELASGTAGQPLAIRPIGEARRTEHGEPLPLYRRPLATGPGLGTLDAAWVGSASDRAAIIRAIARIVCAVHRVGAVLGLVHPDVFAYGFNAGSRGREGLRPTALLAYAPVATPIGQAFPVAGALAPGAVWPRHRHLGIEAVPHALRDGAMAARVVDAEAVLTCALDLLALEPLPAGHYVVGRRVAAVTEHLACFAHPKLALRIATVLDEANAPALATVLDWLGQTQAGLTDVG